MEINWNTHPYDKISHSLIAVGIFLPFALVGFPIQGALCAISLFYGREQSQAAREYRVIGNVPFKMYLPWNWKKDCRDDFYYPSGIVSTLALLQYFLF